jgi:hypothetical protein
VNEREWDELVDAILHARGPALTADEQEEWDRRYSAGRHYWRRQGQGDDAVRDDEIDFGAARAQPKPPEKLDPQRSRRPPTEVGDSPKKRTQEENRALREGLSSEGSGGSSFSISTRGAKTRAHPSDSAVRRYARALGFEKPTRDQRAVLARRLAFEEGRDAPPPIAFAELPADARPAVRKVYDGVRLLVACRWAHTYGAPVVLARSFLPRWCGVSEDEFRAARYELHRRYGVIERLSEKKGRAWQWLPARRNDKEGET